MARYDHIFLPSSFSKEMQYTRPKGGGGSEPKIPQVDRALHASQLEQKLANAWKDAEASGKRVASISTRHGAYILYESEIGAELPIQGLENVRSGIRLLNAWTHGSGDSIKRVATVYVPNDKKSLFLNRIKAYGNPDKDAKKSGKPKHHNLMNCIADIRHAVMEAFWPPEDRACIPEQIAVWIEIWISSDRDEIIDELEALLGKLSIQFSPGVLKFPERAVKLIHANRPQLEALVNASDYIAEFRIAKKAALYFLESTNREQAKSVENLLQRTQFNDSGSVSVCILDTGINNGHPLIMPVLAAEDMHSIFTDWQKHDHHGHGTGLAGLVVYGDLHEVLSHQNAVLVNHRLESVKLLPPDGSQHKPEFWGFLTIQGVSLAEIQSPARQRIVCMAVTSRDIRERGRPSSWSAALDELTSGYEDDKQRLIIVSAGNIDDQISWKNYPDDNKTNEVHDPGQAWNVLTVGAFTQKYRINDPMLKGYAPVAPDSGLSPYSTTSYTWDRQKWPIKPEIVMEGGNIAQKGDAVFDSDELKLLTTGHDPQIDHIVPFGATSAASALAAKMAAQLQSKYPAAWPETIRALMVHSAEWTPAMLQQFFEDSKPNKSDYSDLLHICGYGVPNLERAMHCTENSLTLIAEREIQPYDRKDNGDYGSCEMHVYDLPWPVEILAGMLETPVTMRVTLSYFVEPGPGEIGWTDRYRYASHALRFKVNGPLESKNEFVARINEHKDARGDDPDGPDTEGAAGYWMFGEARNVGSIHSDIWSGTAAELATSRHIGVFPVIGWWRERHHLCRWNKKCRYSLIVSINTPRQDVDIYIPVIEQIRVKVPIDIQGMR